MPYAIGNSETVKNIYKILFNLSPIKLKYLRLQLTMQDTIPVLNGYRGLQCHTITQVEYGATEHNEDATDGDINNMIQYDPTQPSS
ncbi:unnamed protein product [Rotaria sp. Silwood2]|nr:unnamed protein product [Rotaria sp. Silwood2]